MRHLFFIASFVIGLVSYGQKDYPCHMWKRYTQNCLTGFVDPEGKVMIEPQFEYATDFSDGRAFVWNYLDQADEKAVVPLGEEYQNYESFGLGGNRKTGIIDSTGKFVVEPKVNFIVYSAFIDSIALVRIDNKYEIIDINGAVVSNTYQNYFEKVIYKNLIKGKSDNLKPGSKCYMTRKKQFVSGPYQNCEPYSEGYGAVRIGGKYGYVNLKGEMKIVPQFMDAHQFSNGYAVVSVLASKADTRNKNFGLIDTNGTFVIAPNHYRLGKFSEGKIAFFTRKNKKTKYGFLDVKGNVVIKPKYEHVKMFKNGLAAVKIKEKYGYINSDGKMIIPAKFLNAQDFKYGTALVQVSKKKWAFINLDGEIIVGPWKRNCN